MYVYAFNDIRYIMYTKKVIHYQVARWPDEAKHRHITI